MARSRSRPKNKPRNKSKPSKPLQKKEPEIKEETQENTTSKSLWAKIKLHWKRFVAGFGVIMLFVGAYFTFKNDIRKSFESEHETYERESFIKGIFIPDAINHVDSFITIAYGTNQNFQFPKQFMKEGVLFNPNFFGCKRDSTTPFNLRLLLRDNRLYIATTFKDIQKNEVVGVIEYESWKLKKDNLFDFIETDRSLRVIDRGGNVIFSLQYVFPNKLLLHGYSISEKCIFVLGTGIGVYNIESKDLALNAIKKISSLIPN
jgi:hypothetical protein